MKRMFYRLMSNFIIGYCVCSAVINIAPVTSEVVPVVVFDSDAMTTSETYRTTTEVPQLFQFDAKD